jgi:hypothetical protein
MDEIQRLAPGTKIRLTGELSAAVESNPRDGAWLVARSQGRERLRAASKLSSHGFTLVSDPDSLDVLIYVHADDILGILP